MPSRCNVQKTRQHLFHSCLANMQTSVFISGLSFTCVLTQLICIIGRLSHSCFCFVFFPQEFSSYNSLGQGQFSQYYALPPSYVPAGLPSSDDHSASVGVAGYSAVKSEEAASAGLPPRGDLILGFKSIRFHHLYTL